MLVTLYEICDVHFRLLGTSGYHLKTKNKRLRNLRSDDGKLQGKRHIKIELHVKFSLLRLFCVDHVVQNSENNRAARAARTLVAFFDVVYQTTT